MITAQQVAAICRQRNLEPTEVLEVSMESDGHVDFGNWHIQVGESYLCLVESVDGGFKYHKEIDLVCGGPLTNAVANLFDCDFKPGG